MDDDIRTLSARLIASRYLPRNDKQVRKALIDESFRLELDRRLGEIGYVLLDNPYAENVAIALRADMADPVFGGSREYAASNLGLNRDEVALLVILWALIILPKRERQMSRQELDRQEQNDMFGNEKPIQHGNKVSAPLSEASVIADFGQMLGGKTKLRNFALSKLSRLGFIERRQGMIQEGPLLDVVLDYRLMAERIIHGTLGQVLRDANHYVPALAGHEQFVLADADSDDLEME